MKTVYVVYYVDWDYDNERNIAAFSSKENADQFIKENKRVYNGGRLEIDEREIPAHWIDCKGMVIDDELLEDEPYERAVNERPGACKSFVVVNGYVALVPKSDEVEYFEIYIDEKHTIGVHVPKKCVVKAGDFVCVTGRLVLSLTRHEIEAEKVEPIRYDVGIVGSGDET